MLCLASAIHNFKWVKIIQIWQNEERVSIVPLHHSVITFYRPQPPWMTETFIIAKEVQKKFFFSIFLAQWEQWNMVEYFF